MKVIGIMVLMIIITGCSDNNSRPDSLTQILASPKNTVVTPESIYIDLPKDANFEDDFKNSIESDDFRFVGVMGYALIVPRVPDYYEKYQASNGVKIIQWRSDIEKDSSGLDDALFGDDYARGYNLLLLDYLAEHIENDL